MIKRLAILAVALGSTSCDRQTSCQILLSVGLNADSKTSILSHVRDVQSTGVSDPHSNSAASEAATALGELRTIQQIRDRSPTQQARAYELIDRLSELSDTASPSPDASALAEAKLAALTIGAELLPEAFSERNDAFAKQLGASLTGETLEAASAQRVVRALADDEALDGARHLVALHAATYPQCKHNLDLFLDAVERLTERQRIRAAVQLAREGIRGGSLSDVSRLSDLLRQVYADHPGEVGTPMNFVGPDLQGQRFELNSMRGRAVLVVFWASWCDACREESAVINRIAEQCSSRGLQVVGVNLDKDRTDLEMFLKEQNLTWLQIHSREAEHSGWDNPIAKHYKVTSVPHTVLVGKGGDIVAAGLRGERAIRRAVEQELGVSQTDNIAAR